jgi:hypothetical protein
LSSALVIVFCKDNIDHSYICTVCRRTCGGTFSMVT